MYRETLLNGVLFCLCLLLNIATDQSYAHAAAIGFREDFNVDHADWANFDLAPLTHVSGGGPDGGGYVSTGFSFSNGGGAGGTSAVIFRAHDEFGSHGSSDNAFAGNWISDGVMLLTAMVRHQGPEPLNYFFRGSGPFNFPGATVVDFIPVPPRVWTKIEFEIAPSSRQFVSFEGSDFSTVFSDIGHLQFGVAIPESLKDDSVTYAFDLDQVTIKAPEPTTLFLSGCTLLACLQFVRPGSTNSLLSVVFSPGK